MYPKTLLDYDSDTLKALLAELGMPSFRYKQIYDWIFKKFVFSFDRMTNLSLKERVMLNENFNGVVPQPASVFKDRDDGSLKILYRLHDDNAVEAVAIPAEDGRMTFCLSTQVGCAVRCPFCKTGESGLIRNLTVQEIVTQLIILLRYTGKKPTNIVYMGMGEPFNNREALFGSIDVFTDPSGLRMATRRITISTSGVIPGIEELSAREGEVNLAVSLHTADNDLRNKLVPINKTYPLDKLRRAIQNYTDLTGRRVTLEVSLLKDVNDGYHDAMNIASFCEGMLVHVNLIRFNYYKGSPYRPAAELTEKNFRKALKKEGVSVTVRKSAGSNIMAACGQLSDRSDG